MTKDEFYIKRCIELAKKAIGKTYPNPMVGSVIVHGDEIIGEGYHHKAGENHAEINAINSVKNPHLIPESTLYVSLEPCAHFGKTPPCSLKIKELGFKKVVIGAMDSHDKVNGKGKKIIQDAGIEVVSGILEEECIELNKRFFTFHEKKRPYIILKWAQSKDGFVDKDFQPAAISNALVNQIMHKLRADEDAILVGTQTAIADNPSLTVRNVTGKNPTRIILDWNLKIPSDYNIFNQDARTIIINSVKDSEEHHIQYIKTDKNQPLQNIIDILYQQQIQSVIIEGGAYTLQRFIDENLWDEVIIITNNNLELQNGTKAPILSYPDYSETQVRNNSLKKYFKS